MELRLRHIIDHLYKIFRENDGKENCAQLLEEECNKMFGINDEQDCNVVSMNSLNIHEVDDDRTSESMDPRPHFQALQYRLCSVLSIATLLFFYCYYYKNQYLLSILHLYHHLFAELVHPYNLPLYLVC